MRKIILLAAFIQFFISCTNDDFLELTPTTQVGEGEEFWNNESGLETYSNSFYGYIDRNEITGDFTSDNAEHRTNPPSLRRKDYVLPTSLGSGGWNWSQLRNINYFIEKTQGANVQEDTKQEYIALAKFFRAWFYFKKVKAFGDVPWYSEALSTSDEEKLYKPRDSRITVMDSVVADLDYAIDYLPENQFKNRISKWTALALKSRISLYEGTWRKYHTEAALPSAEKFLRESLAASTELLEDGPYSLYTTGNPEVDYFNLFQPKDAFTEEVILARSSDTQTFYYTPLFTSTSNGNYGATKSFISSYLMKDGTSLYQEYSDENTRETMPYHQEFKDRDPRLAQTILSPGYIRVGTTEQTTTDFAQNSTGYAIIKRVGPPIEDQGGGYRDVIIIRFAEILLNYAEASAELGALTQSDLDRSVNLIRERSGIPPLNLNAPVDPTQQELYPNVSSNMILEVRRERRIELAFEGFRTDDLERWKAGHLFRAPYEGIYIKGLRTYIDLDNDGNDDLYVYPTDGSAPENQISGVQYFRLPSVSALSQGDKGRIIPFSQPLPTFEDWEYLSPLPLEELTLNPELTQNPEWDKQQ